MRWAAALTLGTAVAMTAPALAQTVAECDWRSQARAIAEPWEAHTRTFANGDVRLALLDTVEPAAGALHMLILSPPYDELGTRQCRVISLQDSIGFAALAFDQLTASYDPAVGLIFTLPAGRYDPDTGGTIPAMLGFTLNQASGAIHAQVTR